VLAVEGVEVAFDSVTALHEVDLDVADAEVVAVLGPSGSGKTTLLRAIAGLVPLAGGRVCLDGRDLATVPTHRRGLGLMFQDYALFPHRDVAGNVEFGLRMQGRSGAERATRVAEVLALVGLEGFGGRAVSSLSGGERQRVALARALAPSPKLLMLDEPFGALDRELRERLLVDLAELFDQLSVSVVYVTHDQSEALALADQIVVMDRGRVAQRGAPAEVWSSPANATVARFLGFTNLVAVDGPDGPATMLVRPEAVRVSDVEPGGVDGDGADAGPPGSGVAVVEASVFRGDHVELALRLASGETLSARVPPTGGRAAGTRVRVELDRSGTQVL
jgi:thiamine transport system ATP-binding protein